MRQFVGTHQNRLDAKGRVSVPAPFRALLKAEDGAAHFVLRPSHKHPCIEAWPEAAFNGLEQQLEGLDLFSEDHDDMAVAIYADAYPVEADKEGRVLLPESLVVHAGLSGSVTFLGAGKIFQIWEPAAAEAHKVAVRQRNQERGVLRKAVGA
ncbi:MAG: cell division/cell wall cluster transcriptional repressor MraZ [Acidocella sp. 20-57-95]|nr:MAG: cell division/cell wall cluster transcriptional repressor MraZ [Acidocella sp. 20-57-95]HQT63355.1 division/cell wall cluster transcriptional repressor MraZ [Acidocella sp.]HQU03206.1 division/cell wall cluster transcriptional repressor MraZ [Acidocella sp.]